MQNRSLAVIGSALLLAPLYFVSASLLKYGLGVGGRREIFNLVSPVVFLGGLSLALALNVYAVTRFDVGREEGTIVGTLKVTPGLWNIAIAAARVLLLVILVGYAFLENLTYH